MSRSEKRSDRQGDEIGGQPVEGSDKVFGNVSFQDEST